MVILLTLVTLITVALACCLIRVVRILRETEECLRDALVSLEYRDDEYQSALRRVNEVEDAFRVYRDQVSEAEFLDMWKEYYS